jgi:hypothetical protein
MPGNLNEELLCSITSLSLIAGSYTSTEELVASWQKETQPSFQKKDLGAVARKKRQSVVFKNHVTEKYTTA